MKAVRITIFLVISIALLSGCKAWKKNATDKKKAKEDVEMARLKTLVDEAGAANLKYQWLEAKLSGETDMGGSKLKFKAILRMQKDSVIWISVSPGLGFEIVRVMMTPDSVKVLNRLERSYYLEEYSAITAFLGVDVPFETFQNLLVGNMPELTSLYSWEADTLDNLHVIREKSLENSDQVYEPAVKQEFRLDPASMKLKKLRIEQLKPKNRLVSFSFSDFQISVDKVYPSTVEAMIYDGSRSELKLNYKKLEVGESQRFPFNINPKFKKLEIEKMPR